MNGFNRMLMAILMVISISTLGCDVKLKDLNPNLSFKEKKMPEAKYYSTDFAPMTDEIADAVAAGPIDPSAALAFEDVKKLIEPGYLETENGYCMVDDTHAFAAVRTDMPGVTKEMIQWWFWWHTLKNIRYKIWCPEAHYAIDAEDMDRMTDETLSPEERYLYNTNYPIEDVGFGPAPLAIEFITPKSFGFDTSKFKENGIEGVICGVVGFKIGDVIINHTYMCHLLRKKGDGLEMRSRFWMGNALKTPALGVVINEQMALDMMLHCTLEYNHLAGILPDVYAEFSGDM